jgi:hypothetical protein
MIAAYMRSATSPLSLHRHLPERSSPSRVRFAAQNPRALDRSGPFRKLISDKGKQANAKPHPLSVYAGGLPLVGPRLSPIHPDPPPNPKIRLPP